MARPGPATHAAPDSAMSSTTTAIPATVTTTPGPTSRRAITKTDSVMIAPHVVVTLLTGGIETTALALAWM
jgi:hypothetical protein